MSLVINTLPITTAGTKQFGGIPPIFKSYQVKDDHIPFKLYWDDSSAFPVSNVGTGTHSSVSSLLPKVGNLYETVYNPADTASDIPVVAQKRDYTRISAAANNDGAKVLVNWDLSNENWFVIVVKSTGTSVAGKLIIRSTAGNESVCTFTTSGTANTWERKIFPFKDSSDSAVSFTGTPNFSAITQIEVTLDALSTVVDVAMTYAVNTTQQIIGHELTIVNDCVSEAGIEDSIDVSELLCSQLAEAQTATARTAEVTLGSKKKNPSTQAIALGNPIRKETVTVTELYYSSTLNSAAIAGGTITVASGLVIASVYIDGVGYLEPHHVAANIPEGAFHYTSTTITFNTNYNGKVPKIYIYNSKSLVVRVATRLQLGYVGYFTIPRLTENGSTETWISSKAQVSLDTETFNDDFDQVNFKYKLFPDSNGNFYKVATE